MEDGGWAWGRREVIAAGVLVVLQAESGCALLSGGASHPVLERPAPERSANTWSVPLADLEKVADGDVLELRPGAPHPDLLVTRGADGKYLAVSADCTHKGCTVDWEAKVSEWQCPCHGSRYAPDGRVLEGPAEKPLLAPPVRVEGDKLVIELESAKA